MIACPACGFRPSAEAAALPLPPHLPRYERRLFNALLARMGGIVTFPVLIDAVYGLGDEPDDVMNALHTRMTFLRRRLLAATYPARVLNVRGIGFKMETT